MQGKDQHEEKEETYANVATVFQIEKSEVLEEEEIDLVVEEKESVNFDVAQFRASTVIDEEYIPIHHIQCLLNIREDYCIAIISKASEVAKDFIDTEGESKEFSALDLQTFDHSFLPAPDALALCIKRVEEEKPTRKDEDFENKLVELGLESFGGDIKLKEIDKGVDTRERVGSCNLLQERFIVADELQKIELLDKDNFLGRAKGSREKATLRRDGSSLMCYSPNLDKATFCAFHTQYSDDPELPIFALKVLSRFMATLPFPINVNRVLLLQRVAALGMFGYAAGFNASRARYFLYYYSYATASEETNVNLFGGYKRRKFIRCRGHMPK